MVSNNLLYNCVTCISLYVCVVIIPEQSRSQVSRFGGEKYILGGQDFCFYSIYLKQISWAQHNLGGHCPRMPSSAAGLYLNHTRC